MGFPKPLKTVVHRFGRWYVNRLCASDGQNQVFSHHNERPIEYEFALRALRDACPQKVLDVGTGTTAWPHLLRTCGFVVTAIDNIRDYWPSGMVNRHWPVLDVDILNPGNALPAGYDAITCLSVLEHIANHTTAVRNMVGLLATGGLLVLTTPYSEHNPFANVYKHPEALYGQDAPYICRSSSQIELKEWLAAGLHLEHRELWRLFTGPVWATGSRCEWQMVDENAPHQLGCFVFRKA